MNQRIPNSASTDPKPLPSAASSLPVRKAKTIEKATSHTGLGSNSKNSEFYDILSSLEQLSALPEGSDFHISPNIKERAVKVVTFLHRNYQLPLPKLLPEDTSSMSLTWDLGSLKRFLTVYQDEIEGLIFHRGSGISCVQQVSDEGDIDLSRVAEIIGERPSASTVAGDVDAAR